MNIKSCIKIALVSASMIMFVGCADDDEAKALGFNNVNEMKEIHAKGWHTKQRYEEDLAKTAGFSSATKMNWISELTESDPFEYIKNKKWSLWNRECDPLIESYIIFREDKPLGFLVSMSGIITESKQKSVQKFETLSAVSVHRTGALYIAGNEMLEPYVSDPDGTIAISQDSEITLIAPNKIKAVTKTKNINIEALANGKITYTNSVDNSIHHLCNSNEASKNAEHDNLTTNGQASRTGSSKDNFLIGHCTWEKGSFPFDMHDCNAKSFALELKKRDNGMLSYITWGQSEVVIQVVGNGFYNKLIVPVTYDIQNRSSIIATIHGKNRCDGKDRYTLENSKLIVQYLEQTGDCSDEQKAARRLMLEEQKNPQLMLSSN